MNQKGYLTVELVVIIPILIIILVIFAFIIIFYFQRAYIQFEINQKVNSSKEMTIEKNISIKWWDDRLEASFHRKPIINKFFLYQNEKQFKDWLDE